MLDVLFFRGIGVRMTDPVYLSPSFDNVLPSYLFLQVSICESKIFSDIEIYTSVNYLKSKGLFFRFY